MKNNILYLIAVLSFAMTSCNKDDDAGAPTIPTNLSSVLSLESNGISVDEGKPLIINLNLSKAFSQDLILEGKFTNPKEATYTNDNDFKKEFEYSLDGATWFSEANKLQIKFPKGLRTLKVRLQTNDDTEKELLFEDTQLSFSSKTTGLDIGKEDLNIKLSIKDNDDPEDTDDGSLMDFVFDDKNNYTLKAVTNRTIVSEQSRLKKIVDGGYKQILDDIQYANTLLPVENRVRNFQLLFDSESGLGGFVFNGQKDQEVQGNINNWTMGMNTAFAFLVFGDDGLPPSEIKYNENGIYGYILAHEVGHIMTLARKGQLDATVEESNCSNFFISEGCTNSDAHLNQFNTAFYADSAPDYKEPRYVSRYAETNIAEDIAEVVGTYVTQESIPGLKSESSGALHKVHQIFGKNEFKTFKENFRKKINTGFGLGSEAITKSGGSDRIIFNKFDGKRVPCTHANQAYVKALKKAKKL